MLLRLNHVLASAVVAALQTAALAASPPPAAPAMEWQTPAEAPGRRTLIIRLSPASPRADIRLEPTGVVVYLPGTELPDVPVAGVTVTRDADGSRLSLDARGRVIDRISVDGGTLRLEVLDAPSHAYRIGVGDVVNVSVYKNPDLTGELTVAPDGTIQLPLGGSVTAAGLSDGQLAERIRDVLSTFLVEPQVTVTVKTYGSQFVYVTGAVPRATRVALRPGMDLQDVLSEAGVALGPGQEIELTRTGGAPATYRWSGREADQPPGLSLLDGDVITVAEPRYVFSQGEVKRPNRFVLAQGMTLLQVLSLSEGLTDWANRKDVRILRGTQGNTTEIRVNLNDVEARRAPDPPLEPGDIILVRRKIL